MHRENEMLGLLDQNIPGACLELASSSKATTRLLDRLAESSSIMVLHEVAKNTNCTKELLSKLSKNEDMLVRDYAVRSLLVKQKKKL